MGVVILVTVEGRVEVNEVYGFVFDVASENFEVIAVVESVLKSWQGLSSQEGFAEYKQNGAAKESEAYGQFPFGVLFQASRVLTFFFFLVGNGNEFAFWNGNRRLMGVVPVR
jgi:hypothetical protein